MNTRVIPMNTRVIPMKNGNPYDQGERAAKARRVT